MSYDTKTLGGGTRLGFALREDLTMQLPLLAVSSGSDAALRAQQLYLLAERSLINGGPGVVPGNSCYSDGEASLPIRMALASGQSGRRWPDIR